MEAKTLPRYLILDAEIDLEKGIVLLQVRDKDGNVYPEIGLRIWRAVKNELGLVW